jgi:CrcB protein
VLAAVSAGGGIGSLARYAITTAWPVTDGQFPASTLAVNTSGSFLLGFVLVLLIERLPPSRYARAFIAVGVIGAFTTFSTFAVDTAQLGRDGHAETAAAFFVISVLGGLAAAQLGIVTGRAVPHRHPPPPRHPAEEPP